MEECKILSRKTTQQKKKILFLYAYNIIYIFYLTDNRHNLGDILLIGSSCFRKIRFNNDTFKARGSIPISLDVPCIFQIYSYMNLIPLKTLGTGK